MFILNVSIKSRIIVNSKIHIIRKAAYPREEYVKVNIYFQITLNKSFGNLVTYC